MSKKQPPKPVWYKNTFFWIALVLAIVAVWGLPFVRGDESIRDPGQVREGYLWLIYLTGAIIMFVNGVLSHRQTIQHYQEETETNTEK